MNSPQAIGFDQFFNNPRFSTDDTLLYMGLVRSVLEQCSTVVDVGCGRGRYSEREVATHDIFDLRGANRHVIGVDVDASAARNPYVDEFRLIEQHSTWPIADGSADLVVSDWTMEHVDDPRAYVSELKRVLRPDGLFVGRSVNNRSMLAAASRMVPNRHHARLVGKLQPTRQVQDVFPTRYRMNSVAALEALFEKDFELSIASRPGIENYLRTRPTLAKMAATVERRLPEPFQTAFVICARRLP